VECLLLLLSQRDLQTAPCIMIYYIRVYLVAQAILQFADSNHALLARLCLITYGQSNYDTSYVQKA
jgi:hypothetical protein